MIKRNWARYDGMEGENSDFMIRSKSSPCSKRQKIMIPQRKKSTISGIYFFARLEPGLFNDIASYFSIKQFVSIQEAFYSSKVFREHWEKRIKVIMRHTWSIVESKEALKWIAHKDMNLRDWKLQIWSRDQRDFVRLCSCKEDWNLVKFCLEHTKPDVNDLDVFGCSPLHLACEAGEVEVCKMLCDRGAQLSMKGSDQPIHAAVRNGHYELLPMLVRHGEALYGTTFKDAVDSGAVFSDLYSVEARRARVSLNPKAFSWLERAQVSVSWIPSHYRALICIALLCLETWITCELFNVALVSRALLSRK